MKKLLLIGSEGYVGPMVLNNFSTDHEVTCFDSNWFLESKLNLVPQIQNTSKIYGDIRNSMENVIENGKYDSVIYLAAVSNDPIGVMFAKPTHEINTNSAYRVADLCKKNGVKHFIYASSCSVYGNGNGNFPVDENSKVNPLTDYSLSKYNAEVKLNELASTDFKIGCLRFATAAGPSTNMRYDLVVNDFIMSAITTNEILIKSNGKPWRPIINTIDMANGFRNFINKLSNSEKKYLVANVGFNTWNFTVEEIAQNVKNILGNKINITIDKNAPEDKRSYRVNFDLYSSMLTEKIEPLVSFGKMIEETAIITQKIAELNSIGLYNSHNFKRHSVLNYHIEKGLMDNNLNWIN